MSSVGNGHGVLSLHMKEFYRLKVGPKCMFDLPCSIHCLIGECNKARIQSSCFLFFFFFFHRWQLISIMEELWPICKVTVL